IVDRAGPRPADRGDQHARQIIDMDAGEDLSRLRDALRGTGAQCVERAASRPVDAGEAEDVDRHAAVAPQIEPGGFDRHPPPAARPAWAQLACLIDPAALAAAINSGAGQISEPAEPAPCCEDCA